MDQPIITSFLDVDDYKLTMGQFIWALNPNVPVEFALTNRSKIPLAKRIDLGELREQVTHMLSLRPTKSELDYLSSAAVNQGQQMYRPEFIEFLATNTEKSDFQIERLGDDFDIRFSGLWKITTYPETRNLAIIAELNTRALMKEQGITEAQLFKIGEEKLLPKLDLLKTRPGLYFSDFGHRRRALKSWHSHVLDITIDKMGKQFWGTSDTYFAMIKNVRSVGTNAHELASGRAAMAGLDDVLLRQSPMKLLDDWWDFYGYELSIALPDTFGTRTYLKDMAYERLKRQKGFRQDSMDPFVFGELIIATLEKFGINPKEKMIIFSDGLTAEMMIRLYDHFQGRILMSFGWGTNFTNDVGFMPISMVIKLIKAAGFDAVKLSDNLAKAIGNLAQRERCIRVFEFQESLNQKCVY